MTIENKDANRTGRAIENLDDRRDPNTNPGDRDRHGNRMPDHNKDILETEEEAALDHVQVSGTGDVAEDGEIVGDGDLRVNTKV